jgi:cbb3-type cytochrome oxidase maturation protein
MNVLVYLVPLALALGGLGLVAFLWALRNGQFDDLEGAAWRAISDDDLSSSAASSCTSCQPVSTASATTAGSPARSVGATSSGSAKRSTR